MKLETSSEVCGDQSVGEGHTPNDWTLGNRGQLIAGLARSYNTTK